MVKHSEIFLKKIRKYKMKPVRVKDVITETKIYQK